MMQHTGKLALFIW